MENSKQVQQGTGSAENTGRDRDEQKQPLNNLSNKQKRTIGEDINEGSHDIADLGELGMQGAREDYSGGFGDGMRNENSNEQTER
jgi:hypothetical protein